MNRDDFRDDAVARVWREHANDAPPAAIDDAIRAAARRAVGAKPREETRVAEAREPWRWWMPLAAAATIGAIAVGVIQNLPQDSTEPMVVSDAVTATRKDAAASVESAQPRQDSQMRASPVAPPAPPSSAPVAAPKTAVAANAERTQESRQRQASAPVDVDALKRSPPTARPMESAPAKQEALLAATGRQAAAASEGMKESAGGQKVAADKPDPRPMSEADSQVAAVAKRNDADAARATRDERGSASGFVASPPASPPIVASAPAFAPAPATAGGSIAATREPAAAMDAAPRAKVRAAPERSVASAAQAPSGARASGEPQAMAVTPPDVYIAAIRRLLAAGDREGAARELRTFRRTHVDADARLPVDLREFAASVPR